jgi:GNAT superfamily N-acetyltransferase
MTKGIRFTDVLDDVSASQLSGFFVGWPAHPDPERHLEILRRSYKVWLAFDGDRCVGFINALSDGIFYAFVPLLEVLPDYQGMGIGSELVARMMDSLSTMYAIDIVCDEEAAPFYTASGFSRRVGMAKRNYANQRATA